MSDCRVCSTPDDKKPQIFRGETWCCDRHRKIIQGDIFPTEQELDTMNQELAGELLGKPRVDR